MKMTKTQDESEEKKQGGIKINNLERTVEQLDRQVTPARPGMKATKRILYSNEETGTAVYQVLTDNASLPHPVTERMVWGYFLVGNPEGYSETGCYLESEAYIRIGEISEDRDRVLIPMDGYKTIHFGIQVKVSDLEFKKSKFKPYDES